MSTNRFPNAKFKRFKSLAPAEQWYLEQMALTGAIPLEHTLDSDEDSDKDAVAFDSRGRVPGFGVSDPDRPIAISLQTINEVVAPRSGNADLVDFRMAGPDPLVGESKAIHGMPINITKEVRGLLCPKGTTQEMHNRMLEVMPDVLTCQGKNLLTKSGIDFELENMWNRFAEAMSDIADVQTQKMGAQPRDTQWNMPSRNSLDKVKSLEGLMEFADELSRNSTSVLEYAKSAYLEILFTVRWTLEDAKIYCKQGGLTILVRRTYNNFYSLLQNVIGKSFKNPKQWDDIGQQHIDHHVKQLAQMRTFSNRREIMLYRNYAYLRDGQAVGFQDSKLVSKLGSDVLP
jgi:hypothetical protein